jgi:hypothetical protein
MKEDNIHSLLQQDKALRDALKMEEAELPQMPPDLNSRVLEKVAKQKHRTAIRRVWPWLTAACVVAFIVVNVMPPKNDCLPTDNLPKVSKVAKVATQKSEVTTEMELQKNDQKQVVAEVKKHQTRKVVTKQQRADIANESPKIETVAPKVLLEVDSTVEIAQAVKPSKEDKPIIISERDIPITRSENYIYTPEEIELMKKQANEAYLKWVELEIEIAKYNLEQTAQK